MLEALKETVCEANLELSRRGVVLYTWGNVSGIDRARGLVVIKPSGVPYQGMQPSDMVVVDLEGRIVEGTLRPSSDTPTHLELYKAFPEIGGVVHTHSTHAVVFAQAGMEIPPLGTTHADYFYGAVPVSRSLTRDEVQEAYEKNTGRVIVETVKETGREPLAVPGVLVRNHGPFTWGKIRQKPFTIVWSWRRSQKWHGRHCRSIRPQHCLPISWKSITSASMDLRPTTDKNKMPGGMSRTAC